ncbi:glycosyltransferase [candidate division KSB1 bacterium]|nr:glycosyltransferase [candidate division KSB1 bacterium]
MSGTEKILHTVIVPAYNEEDGLPVVIDALNKVLDASYEIIVVDDGSVDKTREAANQCSCRVISHRANRGKGSAMRTGLRFAKGENIVFIDADGTYPPAAIPDICKRLEKADMVVAKRKDSENIHLLNRLGNRLFTRLMNSLYKSRVTDALSGLYGVRKSVLQNMDLSSQGFEIETEMTIKAAQMDLRIEQIDISYEQRIGQTKLRPLQDGYRILKKIVMLMFLYNPTAVFTLPGLTLFLFSFGLMAALLQGPLYIGGIALSYHASIFASLMALVGLQLTVSGIAIRVYAILHKFAQPDFSTRLFTRPQFAKGAVIVGLLSIAAAIYFGVGIFILWIETDFSPIFELQKAIFMFFLLSFGLQIIFSSVFLSIFFGEFRRVEMEREDIKNYLRLEDRE